MTETRTAHYLKYFCEHEKYKYQCRECKGSQICPHNKRKPQCKECVGSQICTHSRRKDHCKKCEGSQICPHNRLKRTCKKCSDPIKITIEQWIFNSRQYDKMRKIYDADRFIDKCFLEGLIEDYKQCYYGDCQDAVGLGPVNLQYTEGMVGGPSIVFCRHAEAGVSKIRSHIYREEDAKICRSVQGLDANSLYLFCSGQEMPCGKKKVFKCNPEEKNEII